MAAGRVAGGREGVRTRPRAAMMICSRKETKLGHRLGTKVRVRFTIPTADKTKPRHSPLPKSARGARPRRRLGAPLLVTNNAAGCRARRAEIDQVPTTRYFMGLRRVRQAGALCYARDESADAVRHVRLVCRPVC